MKKNSIIRNRKNKATGINHLQKEYIVIACLGLKQFIWIIRKNNKRCSRGQATAKLGTAANGWNFPVLKPRINHLKPDEASKAVYLISSDAANPIHFICSNNFS